MKKKFKELIEHRQRIKTNKVQCYICKEYFDKDDEALNKNRIEEQQLPYRTVHKIEHIKLGNSDQVHDVCYKCGNMLSITYAVFGDNYV